MPKSDQGVFTNRYQVIPRTLIFLMSEDEVLLLKGAPTKRLWANLYNGIGGHVEPGEDILSSARRELKEETGLVVEHLWLCGSVLIDASDQTGIALFVFKGAYAQGEMVNSKEGNLEWVRISGINSLPLVEDLVTILPRVIAMHAGDEPFSARYFYDRDEKLNIEFGR
jgi:8-oxo-dGTP diphosphatase